MDSVLTGAQSFELGIRTVLEIVAVFALGHWIKNWKP